jgi:Amt family ammonium transporter
VVITPAAGVVQPAGAIVLGALSSIACYWALNAKFKFGYDDSLDCFGIHGIGSGLGVILLSFFIRDSWMEAAAGNVAGWNMWQQLLVQFKGLGVTVVFAALVTLVICFLLEKTVGFRADEQSELEGLDKALHGENGYGLIFPEAR